MSSSASRSRRPAWCANWYRLRGRGWRTKLAINGLGALATGAVTLVVAATKLTQGAWIVILLVPTLVLLFIAVHRHYAHEKRQVATHQPPQPLHEVHVLIPVRDINKAVKTAMEYAISSGAVVRAVHVSVDPEETAALQKAWADWAPEVQLISLDSPYREVVGILIDYIKAERARAPDHKLIVAITEVVPRRWYQEPLHNQTAIALAASLRHVEGVTFGLVPFQLK